MSPAGARERGSTLVEALVALVLVAFAGAVVAAAAETNLRATRAAAVLEQLTAGAAADLARAEARGAPEGVDDQLITDPTLGAGVEHRVTVTRSGDVVTLEARVVAPGSDPFVLATRQYVPR
ncbi:MAG TPA: prepilin-type N-terminal cleavage/methylation domain-containing protein [Candidatus Binatia bacterium]|jgi:type II secretory pathway pseudopilin PulG